MSNMTNTCKWILAAVALVALFSAAGAYTQVDQHAQFAEAYWAAQPPAERVLNTMEPFSAERAAKAVELAQAGATIDREIEAIGAGNPLDTMRLRAYYGYTWVPSLLGKPVKLAPGITVPANNPLTSDWAPYDPDHPPSGSIKVSANLADYPAYDPPAPVIAPSNQPVVGARIVGNLYFGGAGDSDSIPDGATWKDARGTFVKVLITTPFGASRYWRLE